MDTLTFFLMFSVFFFVSTLVGFIFLMWKESHFKQKRQIKKRLLLMSAGGMQGNETLNLYKEKALKDAGIIEKLALELPRVAKLDRMLLRSKLPLNATTFILGSLAFGGLGIALAFALNAQVALIVALPLLCGGLPYFFLRASEQSTLRKFKEQYPSALDLLARAVRSGHALSSAMNMVAEEMEDPIRSEFATLVDEIKLGLTINEALNNLCKRVPVQDLRFFSISIQIQKETGGNIAEIFDNLSRLMRERDQFQRQVKALTAEGRMSAGILIALPILLFAYLYFVNFDYISLLWTEEIGRQMMLIGIASQIVGIIFIRKIVKIEI